MQNGHPKHIGIVACSAEGAALCYRTICQEGAGFLGPHAHPEISLHSHSLADYVDCLTRGDLQGVGELMLLSANKLAGIGADFLICPDNTVHQAFSWVEPRSPRPWLHIAQVVAAEAAARGVPAIVSDISAATGARRNPLARRQRGLPRQACRARLAMCSPRHG